MRDIGRALANVVQRFPSTQTLVVAFSGGRDSHVLLHAASAQAQLPSGLAVRALHIDHGLHIDSAAWAQHCQLVCDALNIPLETIQVAVHDQGRGPEAAAREARYRAFELSLQANELLLQAHHADDQAETLLLRLLRGAGLRGMSAIQPSRALGCAALHRPLLDIPAKVLNEYAAAHQLEWIEDPSNAETRFDRNFLRLEVLTQLKTRWPQLATQFSAAAKHAAEAEQLLGELMQPVVDTCARDDGCLSCDAVQTLPLLQQRFVLRAWIATHTTQAPSEAQLRALMEDVLPARHDADPCLRLGDAEIRRHRLQLHWVPLAETAELPEVTPWPDLQQPLHIGERCFSLLDGFGSVLNIPSGSHVEIRRRQGGESIELRGHHRPLKKFYQDQSVPSWLRSSAPLLFVDGEIAAVWNFYITDKFKNSCENK